MEFMEKELKIRRSCRRAFRLVQLELPLAPPVVQLLLAVLLAAVLLAAAMVVKISIITLSDRKVRYAVAAATAVVLSGWMILTAVAPTEADKGFSGGGYERRNYTVSKGDTLWDLAAVGKEAFGLSDTRVYLTKLWEENPQLEGNARALRYGTEINLLVPEGWTLSDFFGVSSDTAAD